MFFMYFGWFQNKYTILTIFIFFSIRQEMKINFSKCNIITSFYLLIKTVNLIC